MSGNKMTDSKQQDALDVDSGFQSGFIPTSEEAYSFQYSVDEENKSDKDAEGILVDLGDTEENDKSPKQDVETGFDSGLVQDIELGDQLSKLKLEEPTIAPTPIPPKQISNLSLQVLYVPDDGGDTQLHIAAVHGNEKPMSILIRLCPSKDILDLPNNFGHTALHLAVMGGNAVITRMLVLAGADIGIRDRRGETPLHKATHSANVKCIQALLMAVVQTRQRKTSEVLDQKNYNGQACVHIAAKLGNIETLQALLFYGANINSTDNLSGWAPLHIAASRGDARLIQFLQRCSSCDQRVQDFTGRTARRLARYNQAAKLFERHEDSDSDSDPEDDIYDEELESLYEKITKHNNKTMVA